MRANNKLSRHGPLQIDFRPSKSAKLEKSSAIPLETSRPSENSQQSSFSPQQGKSSRVLLQPNPGLNSLNLKKKPSVTEQSVDQPLLSPHAFGKHADRTTVSSHSPEQSQQGLDQQFQDIYGSLNDICEMPSNQSINQNHAPDLLVDHDQLAIKSNTLSQPLALSSSFAAYGMGDNHQLTAQEPDLVQMLQHASRFLTDIDDLLNDPLTNEVTYSVASPWPTGEPELKSGGAMAPNAFQAKMQEKLMRGMPKQSLLVNHDLLEIELNNPQQFPSHPEVQEIMNWWIQAPVGHDYLLDGCFARAHILADTLVKRGIATGKVFVSEHPNGEPLQASNQYYRAKWGYHVAALVLMRDQQGEISPFVLDASLSHLPQTLVEWTAKFEPNKGPLQIEIAHHSQYSPANCAGIQRDFETGLNHALETVSFYHNAHLQNLTNGVLLSNQ